MDWTDDLISQLRTLWDEGHSTAEIGRRLGVSKNAVVGKAHRLDLPARPSPIRKMSDGTPPARRQPAQRRTPTSAGARPGQAPGQVPGHTPGQPASQSLPQGTTVEKAATLVRAFVDAPAAPPASRPALRPVALAPRTGPIRVAPCCWPIGEPGSEDFHFCCAGAVPGKPYCEEHVQIAYVKVRDRREEAA